MPLRPLYSLLLAMAALALRLPWFRAHRERLGIYPGDLLVRLSGRRVLWLHNASVGELLAAKPLVRLLRERLPDRAILLSATSFAGRELAGTVVEADGAVLLPLDSRGCVARALDGIRPEIFVFTETELWPNLLRALADRRIPAALVSGRISPRTFRRYRAIRPFLEQVLSRVALFGMQTEEEARRIRALGAPPERVRVTGSLKLDRTVETGGLVVDGDAPLWVAGSTHPGEEEICARVFVGLRERYPSLRFLLAPRHLDRAPEVEALLERAGIRFVKRSNLGIRPWRGDPEALLLDTLGELAAAYSRASVAFVGGTLAPIGGHNLLEPARAGVPVVYGPHVEKVAETAVALERAGGGVRVGGESELEAAIASLLFEPERRTRMGRAAREAFAEGNAGEESVSALLPLLREA